MKIVAEQPLSQIFARKNLYRIAGRTNNTTEQQIQEIREQLDRDEDMSVGVASNPQNKDDTMETHNHVENEARQAEACEAEAEASVEEAQEPELLETALEQGYNELVMMVLEEEIKESTTKDGSLMFGLISTAYATLVSMETRILRGILQGSLALEFEHDARTRSALGRLYQRGYRQPCIYQQILVDRNGLSPTPNQLKRVMRKLISYAYPNKAVPSDKVEAASTFAFRIDSMYEQTWSMMDQPLVVPLVEYGYTQNAGIRFANHRNRKSSNYRRSKVRE